MKKIYQIVALLLVGVLIFTACGSSGTTSAESKEESSQAAESKEEAPAEESKEEASAEESKEEEPAASSEPIYCALVGPMTGDNAQYG